MTDILSTLSALVNQYGERTVAIAFFGAFLGVVLIGGLLAFAVIGLCLHMRDSRRGKWDTPFPAPRSRI
jgi:hypothetical protein